MFDALMTPQEKSIRDEARDFVRTEVPRQLILDMDAGKVTYPREYLQKLAARRLLGLRFDPAWGGRGLPWTAEILALEEVGVLGTSLACLYSLPSIIGEALHLFGTPEQKDRYLRPTLEGRLTCAEALTEPRGGSDFFGTTCQARREGDGYVLNGQKRFVVGAEGADYFLVYARTHPTAPGHQAISTFLVDRGPGVEVQHVYGLLGTRGGGTGRIYFRDARVPAANQVGVENGGADIFWRLMARARLTSAAGALGWAAPPKSCRYSDRCKAFGQKIRAVNLRPRAWPRWTPPRPGLCHGTHRGRQRHPGPIRRPVSEAKKVAPRPRGAWSTTPCRSRAASAPTCTPLSDCC